MKKNILLTQLLLVAFLGLNAQSLLLSHEGNFIGNGSEIYISSSPGIDPVDVPLVVLNNSSSQIEIKVHKTDLQLVSGANSSMCWGTSCYPPFVIETPESVILGSGQENSSFRGDYTHFGITGTSRVLFSFFNVNNPADSTWLIVNYQIANLLDHSFEVTHNGSVIANDDEISLLFEPGHDPAEIATVVKNINAVSVNTRVKKYDLSLIEGTNSNICWGPSCYPPFVFDTPEAVLLASGATDESFRGDYTHSGIQGTSKVRFTIYNVDNPNDSLSFVVNYTVGYVGIPETVLVNAELGNAYPNPVVSTLNVDYKLVQGTSKAFLRISNLLGTTIAEVNLNKTEGKASMDVSNLKNGIYFYSLMINNSAAITRKFVVKR